MKTRISLFFLPASALLLCSLARAQPIPGRYIVEFDSEAAVAAATSAGVRLADAAPRMAARRTQLQAEHATHEAAIRSLGGTVTRRFDTALNGMAVQIPAQRVDQLRALPGVKGVYADKLWHPVLDQAVIAHRFTDAWKSVPGGTSGAGAGTMIAVVDTGIDVNHPGFQGFTTSVPAGFPLVSSAAEKANTNNKIIVSRDYTGAGGLDTFGHGTGNAMIAAGMTNTPSIDCFDFGCNTSFVFPENSITGGASGAWLANYKVCDNNGCLVSNFLAALGDVINDAATLQSATGTADVRVIVNYSAGGPVLFGSDENGAEARAIHNAVAAGVLVVIAAGDDGTTTDPSGVGQAPSTISDPGLAADALTVGAVFNQRLFDISVTVAGMAPFQAAFPDTSMDINSPDLIDPVSGPIADVAGIDGNGFACSALTAGSLAGKIALIQRSPVGSATACSFNTKRNNAATAGAVAAVVYNSAPTGLVGGILTDASLPALFLSLADGQALKAQIAANAGTSVLLDFAGFTPFQLTAVFPQLATSDVIATYSPAGPTPAGNIKPDLLAVGGDFNAVILTADATANDRAHPYTVSAGTSLSAPFVAAGLAALKSARPGLTPAQYRSLIVNSAPQFTSALDGTVGTPNIAGTGKMDVLGALQNNLAAVPSSINFQTAAGQVASTKPVVFTNVGSAPDTFSVTVNPIDGSIAPSVDAASFSLAPGASQTVNVALSGTNLQTGAYDGYLTITGTQTQVATRIGYWFGVPGTTVQGISVLNQNQLNAGGSPADTVQILIRYTDQIGLPVAGALPAVTAVAARSSVKNVAAVGDIPGTFEIDVQLGRVRGIADEFDVTVGSLMIPVFVSVQ